MLRRLAGVEDGVGDGGGVVRIMLKLEVGEN